MSEDADIIELLLIDHEVFRGMFTDLETVEPAEREPLFRELVSELASHEAAEEALVHKALRDEVPDGETLAEQVLEEESRAESLLAEIQDVDASAPEFTVALARLRKEVLGHAEHEERDEFPLLREHLDLERRQKLGRRFELLRKSGPTRPHPSTPQRPEVRAAAGPLVGVFDRARDKVRDALSRSDD